MAALALRLMSASRDARLQSAVPIAAIAMTTVLLLLTVGAWRGFDQRAQRTAWRTPQPAADPTAMQALRTDFTGDQPITIVELAALRPDVPVPPGMDRMPVPGELWVSPALARAMDALPADQLADRFAVAPTGQIDSGSLAHPDELVAIVGHAADDPAMLPQPRPRPRVDDGATAAPTGITSWSTTPSQQSKTYLLLARIGAALMAVPLLALAGSASRLVAARRNRRLAQLRLIGGGVGQVVGLTAAEAGVIGASGALLGGVGYVASLPLAVRIPMAGGGWFATDLWVGAAMLVGILFAIAALVTSSAVISLLPVARRPFATARAAHPGMARAWRLAVVAAAVGLFWSVSDGGLRLLAIPLGLVLLALMVAGPWVIRILGTVLARSARTAPGLLAGRRLIDGPRAGWRGVAGMVLAAFVAAYLAAAVPGDVSESVLGPSDRLRLVVVAAQADTAADEARSRLVAAGLDADVSLDEPPSWAPETDRTIWIAVPGDGATLERARTALAGVAPGRVATTPVDDSRSDLLMIDDVRVGAIAVLVSAFLVAAVSAGVGGISWILDQQGILTLVRLAGAPVNALAAARRREVVAPLALCAGAAAILGAALGMLTSGAIGGIGVDGRWLVLFSSLAAAGVLTVLGADLVGRPLLQRATADLADRE